MLRLSVGCWIINIESVFEISALRKTRVCGYEGSKRVLFVFLVDFVGEIVVVVGHVENVECF
jgi:hypothetical protein